MISRQDKSKKIVLKASAGTGKTYRLSLEYIYNLIKGVDYNTIVVMTFTKKATAEIKDRIFDFLYQVAYKMGDWINLTNSLKGIFHLNDNEINYDKLKEIYSSMIKNKDNVRIDTIDRFINKVFKKTIAPFLGINSYATVDDFDYKFYEDLFTKVLENKESLNQLIELSEKLDKKKEIGGFISIIKNLLELESYFIMSRDINHDDILKKSPSIDYLYNELGHLFIQMEEIIQNDKKNKGKKLIDILVNDGKKIYDIYYNINEEIDENKKFGAEDKKEKFLKLLQSESMSEILKSEKNIVNSRFNIGKEIIFSVEDRYRSFLYGVREYFMANEVVPFYQFLKNFSYGLFSIAQQLKIDKKIFSHNDKLNYTYKMIFDKNLGFTDENNNLTDEFFDVLGGDIKVLMIDEFQDTSVLQWKILYLLLNKVDHFICVGDEKQSIYSWRGGEKELFEKMSNMINAKEEELSKSYRSYKEIIENVNKIYDGYSDQWSYTAVDYRDDEDYQKGYFSYKLNSFQITRKNSKKEKVQQTDIIQIENGENEENKVNFLEEIADLLESGKIKNLGKTCILMRKNSQIDEMINILNDRKIPYTVSSSSSILMHKAIQPLYKLLKYILFEHTIFLLEFLRSDLIGVENKHVKYILENEKLIETYFSIDGEANKEKLSIDKSIDTIERHGTMLSDVLQKIVSLKIKFANLKTGEKFTDIAYEIVNTFEVNKYYSTKSDLKNTFLFVKLMSSYSDLHEFIVYLDENKEKLVQESSVDVNAVNLMTIHKSKGLEFDTVIFYKKESTKENQNDKKDIKNIIRYDQNYNNVTDFLVYPKEYDKYLVNRYREIINENKLKNKIEEINSDYVALTRAKKNLIIYAEYKETAENNKKTKNDIVNNDSNIIKLNEKLVEKYGENDFFEIGGIVETEKLSVVEKSCNEMNKVAEENLENDKFKNILKYIAKEETEKRDKVNEASLDREEKRKIGLAVHYYLSHIKSGSITEKKIAKNALISRYSNMIGEDITKIIHKKLNCYINENQKNIFNDECEIYTELVVLTKVDNDGNILDNSVTENYTIKKNIIDRLQINHGDKKITIYDYKTGYNDLKTEFYDEQLKKYMEIVKSIIGDIYVVEYSVLDLSGIVNVINKN